MSTSGHYTSPKWPEVVPSSAATTSQCCWQQAQPLEWELGGGGVGGSQVWQEGMEPCGLLDNVIPGCMGRKRLQHCSAEPWLGCVWSIVFKGGQGSRGACPGKSSQNSGRTRTCQGQGIEGAVGRCQSQPAPHLGFVFASEYGWSLDNFTRRYWIDSWNTEVSSLFPKCVTKQTRGPDRLHFAALLLPVLCLLLCSPATAPPPLLAEFHAPLPVSFPKLLPRICLILCKAQVFLHGLLSLALTAPSRPMKQLRCNSGMAQLIYFKHLKYPPPSASLPTAGCSRRAGVGQLEVCPCFVKSGETAQRSGSCLSKDDIRQP